MGVFGDHVRRYFESGIITIPCKDKRPILGDDWQKFCEVAPTVEIIDKWEARYKEAPQLGLALGAATLVVGFDFDYEQDPKKTQLTKSEFDKDRKKVERQIMALLPPTPAVKVGRKGWTRLYKTHGLLENSQCERDGTRLFDFLAKNKQTIIPPSIYTEGLNYRWVGTPLEDCINDLPYITQDIIEEIKFVCGEPGAERKDRHFILFRWISDVVRVEPDDAKVITDLVALDARLNAVPYLSDPKHFPRGRSAEKNAEAWVKRIRKYVGVKDKNAPPVGACGWKYFFENSFHKIRKDVISKKCFYKLDNKSDWGLMDEVESVLRAYADDKGLPIAKTIDELARWTLEKTETDFLCDIAEWDGVDRVLQYGQAIKSPNFTGDEIADIIKHWGSNIFRRVKSADHQNRCVILKGPQGLGKDYLVRAMLRDFKPYYESTTMPGTQKDALEICSRLLAVHIEEFDQTKHMDMAFMKSLITQPSAFFRESYGASPNQKIMRPSFISTANVDDILRDPTGNRRFIVVPVEGIAWTYPADQSLQVLAQWRHYERAGQFERLPEALEQKIKALIDSFTPEDLSVAIVEVYQSRFAELAKKYGEMAGIDSVGYLTGKEVNEMLMDIARKAQCSLKKVQSSVKGAALSHRFKDGMRYFGSKTDAPPQAGV